MKKWTDEPIRIVITGGHHTPALAVMEELGNRGNFEFHWIGHEVSLSGEATPSIEMRTIKKLGIPFYALRAGKFYRTDLLEWLKIPLGFSHAFFLLLKIRPRLIISFGGYLAGPVVLAGLFLGIPSVTHEQTVVVGWANKFIALLAKKVFVSWSQSVPNFPKGKVVLTGNPVRRSIFVEKTKRFRFRNDLPVIYITGGKQGSHLINEAVQGALSQFLKKYNLLHQTGSSQMFRDYQKLVLLRSQVSAGLRDRYIVQEYFGEDEIGSVYAAASLVVGRSGANTVTELAVLSKPAVLIPLSWVSHQEQMRNAQILARHGAAVVLPEERLSPKSLLQAVDHIASNFTRYHEAAAEVKKLANLNAATMIAEEIIKLLKAA